MANTTDAAEHYQIDVYGVAYNWLQLEDGRAFNTFSKLVSSDVAS